MPTNPVLPFFARLAVQQQILDLLGKLLKWRAQVKAMSRRRDLQHVDQVLRCRTRPQTAIQQWLRPIGNNFAGIKIVTASEAVAFRASAVGAVE